MSAEDARARLVAATERLRVANDRAEFSLQRRADARRRLPEELDETDPDWATFLDEHPCLAARAFSAMKVPAALRGR